MAEDAILELDTTGRVLTTSGQEGPTKKSETRSLRLTADKPIELILGNDYVFKLRRGDDGVVRISMNGFQLPDPDNIGVLLDELNLPAYACVDIRRKDSQPAGLAIEKTTAYDEFLGRRTFDFRIDLPDRSAKGNVPMSGLSIMVGVDGRRAGDNMIFITNHDGDGGLEIAAPVQQPKLSG